MPPPFASWSIPPTRLPELMDDPALPEADHLEALEALGRINAVSRTAAQLAAAVGRRLAGRPGPGPVTVVDVASGGGDVTISLAARLVRRLGRDRVRVVGVDKSPRARARAAAVAAGRRLPVEFLTGDVTRDACPPCDVAVSSLFLHHLDDGECTTLLGRMAAAARAGIVVSDLVRSRLGLALAVVGTTVLSGSRVARIDGPASVRAARTPTEYRRLCAAAGLAGPTLRRTWPERVLIEWSPPHDHTSGGPRRSGPQWRSAG
jgi:2-polyprenyl-3-methyl-5-hydroxy-6-metoxy-1,4-benzoquinol methylase